MTTTYEEGDEVISRLINSYIEEGQKHNDHGQVNSDRQMPNFTVALAPVCLSDINWNWITNYNKLLRR
ncbi:unnamed protein product [Amoebophrya sp. A25]|nr:unnamed protein product [Amoebophrya sp. A25]|eukprot:GSA25T00022176001.1